MNEVSFWVDVLAHGVQTTSSLLFEYAIVVNLCVVMFIIILSQVFERAGRRQDCRTPDVVVDRGLRFDREFCLIVEFDVTKVFDVVFVAERQEDFVRVVDDEIRFAG